MIYVGQVDYSDKPHGQGYMYLANGDLHECQFRGTLSPQAAGTPLPPSPARFLPTATVPGERVVPRPPGLLAHVLTCPQRAVPTERACTLPTAAPSIEVCDGRPYEVLTLLRGFVCTCQVPSF